MVVSHAQLIDPAETHLQKNFSSVSLSERGQKAFDMLAAITENPTGNADASETGEFNLLTPPEREGYEIYALLNAGKTGEAYDLLMRKLEGPNSEYFMGKLPEFQQEFSDRGYADIANDITFSIPFYSDRQLGLGYDFLASGTNAASADPDMHKRNRHAIDRHLKNLARTPEQFRTPYLGYGPT